MSWIECKEIIKVFCYIFALLASVGTPEFPIVLMLSVLIMELRRKRGDE